MKEMEVFKKGNVWGFSFEVYEDEATTEDNRKTSISTRISKTGYTTKEEAITASVVYKAHFFKMPPVTEDDIKEDYALFELIEYGLFTSEDISKYIDYLVNWDGRPVPYGFYSCPRFCIIHFRGLFSIYSQASL